MRVLRQQHYWLFGTLGAHELQLHLLRKTRVKHLNQWGYLGDLLLGPGPGCALCLPLPLSCMLVSEDSGLLRGWALPDALLGTIVVEAAGTLGKVAKNGSSGELLDLPIPEDSLGGDIPVGGMAFGNSDQHKWVLVRAVAQAPPSETILRPPDNGRPLHGSAEN